MNFTRVLIIIPTFNEAENIRELIATLTASYLGIHVLVVDDGSPDGTAQIIRGEQERLPQSVHLIPRNGKGGRGSAVLEGFQWALARENLDFVFEMDADFSHAPGEIPLFLEKIKQYDMVLGSRYLPGSRIEKWGKKRPLFSKWANRYARAVLSIPISDYTNGYRCYTISAIRAIDFRSIDAKGYVVLSEVAYQLHRKGYRIGEVPTVFVNRRRGLSNLGWHEIKEAFLSVLRIRFKKAYRSFGGQAPRPKA